MVFTHYTTMLSTSLNTILFWIFMARVPLQNIGVLGVRQATHPQSLLARDLRTCVLIPSKPPIVRIPKLDASGVRHLAEVGANGLTLIPEVLVKFDGFFLGILHVALHCSLKDQCAEKPEKRTVKSGEHIKSTVAKLIIRSFTAPYALLCLPSPLRHRFWK